MRGVTPLPSSGECSTRGARITPQTYGFTTPLTRSTWRAVHSIGFAGGEVVRKTGLLAALLLGMALAFSPAAAYASPTGGTTTGDDPADYGGGGGHDTEDNPIWESIAKFVDAGVSNFNDWLNGLTNGGWSNDDNGFWGSGGGDFGGGGSSSSSGSGSASSGGSGTSTEDVPTVLTTAQLVTVGETSNGTHKSYTDFTYTGNGLYSRNSTDNPYLHTHVQITTNPRVTSVQIRTSPDFVRAINSYRSAGYDILCIVDLTNGNSDERTRINIIAIQSGCWHYAEEGYYGKYYIDQNAKYASILDNVSVITYWDGSNVFCDTNGRSGIVNYLSTQTRTSYYYYAMINSTGSGDYVSVLYADGSTGTGGAQSGSGDGGSSGDTYNTTNNYNTTTTYNNLDLDLSPITQRQDNLMRTVNQIGKDVNKLVYGLDKDLLRIFQVLALNLSVDRQNGTFLQRILDELTDGYLQDMQSDIDLIAKELTNLQSNSSLQSVKGFLYTINDNIADILKELESLPSGGSGGSGGGSGGSVDIDLTAVTDELEDFHLDAISAWDEMVSRLDTIIDDIEHMRRWQPTTPKPEPPSDLEKALGVDALKDALARLMGKFPFSTINNLVLILTALVRPAVAPVFDLPMPNPSDWSSPYMVHVDLSDWSQVAAMMRVGILLWAIGRVSRRTVNLWTHEEGGGE